MFWPDSQQQPSVVDTEAELTELPFTELSGVFLFLFFFLTFEKFLSQKLWRRYFIKQSWGTVWTANHPCGAHSLETILQVRELIWKKNKSSLICWCVGIILKVSRQIGRFAAKKPNNNNVLKCFFFRRNRFSKQSFLIQRSAGLSFYPTEFSEEGPFWPVALRWFWAKNRDR